MIRDEEMSIILPQDLHSLKCMLRKGQGDIKCISMRTWMHTKKVRKKNKKSRCSTIRDQLNKSQCVCSWNN